MSTLLHYITSLTGHEAIWRLLWLLNVKFCGKISVCISSHLCQSDHITFAVWTFLQPTDGSIIWPVIGITSLATWSFVNRKLLPLCIVEIHCKRTRKCQIHDRCTKVTIGKLIVHGACVLFVFLAVLTVVKYQFLLLPDTRHPVAWPIQLTSHKLTCGTVICACPLFSGWGFRLLQALSLIKSRVYWNHLTCKVLSN